MTITPFSSVLIANRGEIALRIMQSARKMGLRCIAVFTTADAGAPHVRFADQAVCIGNGPVAESYLSTDRILDAARRSGAQAIHPGYGFLSENANFAGACIDAGLVFVGPSPEAIDIMGNKAAAKRLMLGAGVPCVPGYEGDDQSDETLAAQAGRIGFPVMIKAAAGGGGRGMRLVTEPGAFLDALHLAQSEALAGFGSAQIILEKAIQRPRHVEIQILADRQGNTVHLGERDCSVQRRHQKVVEESPGPTITPALRARMGQAAVQAAQAIEYEGAGTVEFLLDQTGAFHFLEMNTRLQVEHPVTELVTGRDLVALQFSIAQGDQLDFAQDDVTFKGHAIEARLYAEDPGKNFLPDTGEIELWHPASGVGIRIDSGVSTGLTVSPHYDPMLAKIIAHGSNREDARRKLISALRDTIIFGVKTNRDFLIELLLRERFVRGDVTTAFLAEEFGGGSPLDNTLDFADIALAAVLTYRALQAQSRKSAIHIPNDLLGWSSSGRLESHFRLAENERVHSLRVVDIGKQSLTVDDGVDSVEFSGDGSDLRMNGQRIDLRESLFADDIIHVATGTKCFALTRLYGGVAGAKSDGDGTVTAPMHGILINVAVQPGEAVVPGTRLAVIEAMKMRHELLAEIAGTVAAVHISEGTQVKAGELLIEIANHDDGS